MKQYNLMYMDYPVQFMITGPDPAVLKRLCGEVEELMNEDSTTMLVTNDWGPMTPVLNVVNYQPIARVANLSREDVGWLYWPPRTGCLSDHITRGSMICRFILKVWVKTGYVRGV